MQSSRQPEDDARYKPVEPAHYYRHSGEMRHLPEEERRSSREYVKETSRKDGMEEPGQVYRSEPRFMYAK